MVALQSGDIGGMRFDCAEIFDPVGKCRTFGNPLFVGWLMGWSIGHALCACSAMEFILWQQHMRGALSRLPMASGPWIWRPTDQAQRSAQMDFLEGLQP
tara:strand:- start:613 stop:909 length:297 start_codon:yes stop_codon:yes gene_type:complete